MSDYVNNKNDGDLMEASSLEDIETASATKQDKDIGTINRAVVSGAAGLLEVATTTKAEIGYVNGVTSAIQTQINSKQATITGAATTIDDTDLTVSRALASDGSGKVEVSATTAAELLRLNGSTAGTVLTTGDEGTGNGIDADTVDGLEAAQFLRSDASDTTTGDLTIEKASPSLNIKCADEATESTTLNFIDENVVTRAILYRPAGGSYLRLVSLTSIGGTAAAINLTEAGKVNVATGTLQLAGTDVTANATELSLLSGETDLHPTGTESAQGELELATDAETVTGTSTALAAHPSGVKAAIAAAYVILDTPELIVAGSTTTGSWQTVNSSTLATAQARAAIIRYHIDADEAAGTALWMEGHIRKTGSGLTTSVQQRAVDTYQTMSSSGAMEGRAVGEVTVNLDSSYDFDWNTVLLFGDTATTTITLVGYIV